MFVTINMIRFLEALAFTFLCALIRSTINNNQIILVLLCVFLYVKIFQEYNTVPKEPILGF